MASNQTFPESASPQDSPSGGGPEAHEDLTIADHLKLMHVSADDRDNASCFTLENGEKHWVDVAEIEEFLRENGAENPTDYLSKHGTSWENDFFKNT